MQSRWIRFRAKLMHLHVIVPFAACVAVLYVSLFLMTRYHFNATRGFFPPVERFAQRAKPNQPHCRARITDGQRLIDHVHHCDLGRCSRTKAGLLVSIRFEPEPIERALSSGMRPTEPPAPLNRPAGHRMVAYKNPQTEQARFELLDRTLSVTSSLGAFRRLCHAGKYRLRIGWRPGSSSQRCRRIPPCHDQPSLWGI